MAYGVKSDLFLSRFDLNWLGPAYLQGDQAREENLGSIAQTLRPSDPELSKPLADGPRMHGFQRNLNGVLNGVSLPQLGF
jgi:hypothetical protein